MNGENKIDFWTCDDQTKIALETDSGNSRSGSFSFFILPAVN